MTKIDYKEKFPCGYEIELHINSYWISNYEPGNTTECPLHGKNCPPK